MAGSSLNDACETSKFVESDANVENRNYIDTQNSQGAQDSSCQTSPHNQLKSDITLEGPQLSADNSAPTQNLWATQNPQVIENPAHSLNRQALHVTSCRPQTPIQSIPSQYSWYNECPPQPLYSPVPPYRPLSPNFIYTQPPAQIRSPYYVTDSQGRIISSPAIGSSGIIPSTQVPEASEYSVSSINSSSAPCPKMMLSTQQQLPAQHVNSFPHSVPYRRVWGRSLAQNEISRSTRPASAPMQFTHRAFGCPRRFVTQIISRSTPNNRPYSTPNRTYRAKPRVHVASQPQMHQIQSLTPTFQTRYIYQSRPPQVSPYASQFPNVNPEASNHYPPYTESQHPVCHSGYVQSQHPVYHPACGGPQPPPPHQAYVGSQPPTSRHTYTGPQPPIYHPSYVQPQQFITHQPTADVQSRNCYPSYFEQQSCAHQPQCPPYIGQAPYTEAQWGIDYSQGAFRPWQTPSLLTRHDSQLEPQPRKQGRWHSQTLAFERPASWTLMDPRSSVQVGEEDEPPPKSLPALHTSTWQPKSPAGYEPETASWQPMTTLETLSLEMLDAKGSKPPAVELMPFTSDSKPPSVHTLQITPETERPSPQQMVLSPEEDAGGKPQDEKK